MASSIPLHIYTVGCIIPSSVVVVGCCYNIKMAAVRRYITLKEDSPIQCAFQEASSIDARRKSLIEERRGAKIEDLLRLLQEDRNRWGFQIKDSSRAFICAIPYQIFTSIMSAHPIFILNKVRARLCPIALQTWCTFNNWDAIESLCVSLVYMVLAKCAYIQSNMWYDHLSYRDFCPTQSIHSACYFFLLRSVMSQMFSMAFRRLITTMGRNLRNRPRLVLMPTILLAMSQTIRHQELLPFYIHSSDDIHDYFFQCYHDQMLNALQTRRQSTELKRLEVQSLASRRRLLRPLWIQALRMKSWIE